MDNIMRKTIGNLRNDMVDTLQDLINKHGIHPYGVDFPSIRNPYYKNDDCLIHEGAYTVTCVNYDNHHIATDVSIMIIIPIETVYETIISCRMDMHNVSLCLRFLITHEYGHVIDASRLISLGEEQVEIEANKTKTNYETFDKTHKLRSNACFTNRALHYLSYHQDIDDERRANELVGLTSHDITLNFYRQHRG